MLLANILG